MASKKKKGSRGLLIKGILERVPKSSFDVLRDDLKEMLQGNSGIYALYKGKKVIYVGLAKDLYWRNFHHSKRDRFASKWDNLSFFIIERVKYLKDLETLVLRISKPEQNRVKGKLPQHNRLKEKLRKHSRELKIKAQKIEKALR